MSNGLKELRLSKGLTQAEMARRLGYRGKSGYCQLEKGLVKMTVAQAVRIAEVLGVNVAEVLTSVKVHGAATDDQATTLESA